MKQKVKIRKIVFCIIGTMCTISFFILGASSCFFWVDGYFQFNEWITSVLSYVGVLISGVFTMIGIVVTLNMSIDESERIKKEKIEKLKLILRFEVNSFISSLEEVVLDYLVKRNNNLNEILSAKKRGKIIILDNPKFEYNKIYKMDSECKNYIYELILLDDKSSISKQYIDFYKMYSILIENIDSINYSERNVYELTSKFLNRKYEYVLYYLITFKQELTVDENRKTELNNLISELTSEFKSEKSKKSKCVNTIMRDLNINKFDE